MFWGLPLSSSCFLARAYLGGTADRTAPLIGLTGALRGYAGGDEGAEEGRYRAMSTIVVKRPIATTASPVPKSMGKNKNSAAAKEAKEAKEVEKAAAKESVSSELTAYGCSMPYSSSSKF